MPAASGNRDSLCPVQKVVKYSNGHVPCSFFSTSYRLSFPRNSPPGFLVPLRNPKSSAFMDVGYLCRFPLDLFVRLGLFRFSGSRLYSSVPLLFSVLVYRARFSWHLLVMMTEITLIVRTSLADSLNWL